MNGVGLVINGDLLAEDRYVGALVHSLGDRLTEAGVRLLVRVEDDTDAESDIYHFWHASNGVDAVALIGARLNDPRIPLLRRLGTPFAAVADRTRIDGFSAVIVDNAAMVAEIRRFLEHRGHRRAIYIAGPVGSDTSTIRAAAFGDVTDLGGDRDFGDFEVVRAERTVEAAVRAAVSALGAEPAVVIFDSDAAAVAAVAAFAEAGKRVPADVAVLSWTDSVLCQISQPTITALDRRASETGSLLAQCLLQTMESSSPVLLESPPPAVIARESA